MDQHQDTNKRQKLTFTENEDKQIISFVKKFGTQKWSLIKNFIKNRTPKQCRDRYMNYLKPGLSNIEWTQFEDNFILDLYHKFGPKWSIISKYFNNRNQLSLRNRFLFLQKNLHQNEAKLDIVGKHKNGNDKKNGIKYTLPDIIIETKTKDNEKQKNTNTYNEKKILNNDIFSNFDNIFDYSDDLYLSDDEFIQ